ncbi:hypothetical protein SISNIDRAFT_196572 [Sistotremastrum niveocremeum HHB9708]|uniref:Galactose oxidase n=1 Tax=Sistotremastrum niveocremeum HHB9708 TaxID=1314777 RepID=A0A164ZJP1_9AGAM|nr:hypothetical protein SISNIDRAFT_196572 [Sistotremastrum niveocremeum HHB9708]
MAWLLFLFRWLCFLSMVAAQTPSTSMTVPPLQWINLSGILKGTPPPPLRDSVIGYDELTRTLVVFGGQSQVDSSVVTQQTYLLDLDNLTWSQPSPSVDLPELENIPPSRSLALGGADFAANSRRDFIMYGGKGLGNAPLTDVWSYNFQNEFWYQSNISTSGPTAAWGAAGGTDLTFSIRNPNPSSLDTILYVLGGSSGGSVSALSEIWELTVNGTLSSNVLDVEVSWSKVSWPTNRPPKVGEASAVLPNGVVVVYGGCNTTIGGTYNSSCAQGDSYIFTIPSSQDIDPAPCPVPRFGAVLTPNYNSASPSFGRQVFLLLGDFDARKWNDSGGLNHGEVAVLDTSSSSWARVIPAGDPGSGTVTYPSPREGSAVLSYPSALVGSNRGAASDTIVFGGQTNNSLVNEVWILRAYNGAVSGTGEHWTGFGSGTLQSGVDADGEGVTATYLTQCAQAIAPSTTSSGHSSKTTSSQSTSISSTPTSSSTGQSTASTTPSPTPVAGFEVSVIHKALSPVSVGLFYLIVILYPFCLPSSGPTVFLSSFKLLLSAATISIIAYVVGIVGIVLAFTSSHATMAQVHKRDSQLDSPKALHAGHSIAGLTLFASFFAVSCVLIFADLIAEGWPKQQQPTPSIAMEEKESSMRPRTPSAHLISPIEPADGSQYDTPASGEVTPGRRQRAKSAGPTFLGSTLFAGVHRRDTRASHISDESHHSTKSAPTSRSFQVVNRPGRRRSHGPPNAGPSSYSHYGHSILPHSLSDISWLERRRSLNAGELDYAISQVAARPPTPVSPTPGTPGTMADLLSAQPLVSRERALTKSRFPRFRMALRALVDILLLATSVFALVALWENRAFAGFAVFLAWIVIAYTCIIVFSWRKHPPSTPLGALFRRWRPSPSSPAPAATPLQNSQYPFPTTESTNPYTYHEPPFRRASPSSEYHPQTSLGHARLVESDPDDDEDDDEKQRRMEEEMQRRDVSIITVPRRQLRIANL